MTALIKIYEELENLLSQQEDGHAIDETRLAALREKLGQSFKSDGESEQYEHWAEIAAENGISRNLFNGRVRRMNWSMEKAATDTTRRRISKVDFTTEEDAFILQGRECGLSFSEIAEQMEGRNRKSLYNRYQSIKRRTLQ